MDRLPLPGRPEASLPDLLTRIAEAVERAAGHLQTIDRKLSVADGEGNAEFLSIKQAAVVAGLSATKIRREIKAGRLPASEIGTPRHPHYRIAKSHLHAWMEKNRGGTSVPPPVPIFKATGKNRHFPELNG